MFKKVQYSFLEKNLKKAGVHTQVEASQNLNIVNGVFIERFGEGVHLHAKPKYIKNRALTVEIVHPAIAEELRLQEEGLISEINKRIGRAEIIRIYFSLVQKQDQEDYPA